MRLSAAYPIDLIEHFGREQIVRALGTADPAEAR
ncbi:DUF6538 domain-containing protein [Caulobacter sp.]